MAMRTGHMRSSRDEPRPSLTALLAALAVAAGAGCPGPTPVLPAPPPADAALAPGDSASPAGDCAIAPADGGQPDADRPDTAGTDLGCPPPVQVDYSCDSARPETCPGGLCLFSQCLGPEVDLHRWDACGNGACDACEQERGCGIDCDPPPAFTGHKRYDDPETLTVKFHGFDFVSDAAWPGIVYGDAVDPGAYGELLAALVPGLVDGLREPTRTRQHVWGEYYGGTPASYLSPAEVAEIESFAAKSPWALHRYALIAAKFIRHRLALSGARHVNIYCHSMGCHITRYLIEHDLEALATTNAIVRWVPIAGVLGGSDLARIYANPTVRAAVDLVPVNTVDFLHLHPDFVTDHSAIYDHRRREANSPLFTGILIHQIAGTDPHLKVTANLISLLDYDNPDGDPNDGIVFTAEEYFHGQALAARFVTAAGSRIMPTVSQLYFDHLEIPKSDNSGVLVAAGCFGSRKVYLSVSTLTLLDDFERDRPLDLRNSGSPPAEIAIASEIRFDPRVASLTGKSIVVHQQFLADHTLAIRSLEQGVPARLDYPVFEGPVLDGMESLRLSLEVLEVDYYPRAGVVENILGPADTVLEFEADVLLADADIPFANASAEGVLSVRVVPLY